MPTPQPQQLCAVRVATFESNSSGSHAIAIHTSQGEIAPPLLPEDALRSGTCLISKEALSQFTNATRRWRSFENKIAYLCWYYNWTLPAIQTDDPRPVVLQNAIQYLTGCTPLTDPSWNPGNAYHDIESFSFFAPNTDADATLFMGSCTERPDLPDLLLQFLRNPACYVQTGYNGGESPLDVEVDMIRHLNQWVAHPGMEPFIASTLPQVPSNWSIVCVAAAGSLPVRLLNGKALKRHADSSLLADILQLGTLWSLNHYDFSAFNLTHKTREHRSPVSPELLTSALTSTGLTCSYPSSQLGHPQASPAQIPVPGQPRLSLQCLAGWEHRSTAERIDSLRDIRGHLGLIGSSWYDCVTYFHFAVPPHLADKISALLLQRRPPPPSLLSSVCTRLSKTLEQLAQSRSDLSAELTAARAELAQHT